MSSNDESHPAEHGIFFIRIHPVKRGGYDTSIPRKGFCFAARLDTSSRDRIISSIQESYRPLIPKLMLDNNIPLDAVISWDETQHYILWDGPAGAPQVLMFNELASDDQLKVQLSMVALRAHRDYIGVNIFVDLRT